ncbi:hypothetical protein F511_47505 [Dorcoceras hygrometricum]|uniref:Uncharacterized protein n=1 Tax=Dorcoceras hygrometricum TaxID=472368 RepID=A0A2Z6ZY34_9LAMI|nr:hypothetical protein F511_47505 [Dorcoceras hygrometricum]
MRLAEHRGIWAAYGRHGAHAPDSRGQPQSQTPSSPIIYLEKISQVPAVDIEKTEES